MPSIILAAGVLALAFLVPGMALAQSARAPDASGTVETTLANGMKVIVKRDARAPTIAHMVWYRAGSVDEVGGKTGVAHVLEHMMFKGTRKVKSGEFSRIVAQAGGRENAFTGRDYTAYFQQVHKSRLELVMRLEADRMANLDFADAEFAREIKVVMEERRWRTDDQPRGLLYENLFASAFKAHPNRIPTIGWMRDLETMTATDAREWYRAWYAPNNAILVVVGDADPATVLRLARKYYGPIARKVLPERKAQDEPAQTGMRRLNLKAPAELPFLAMAWHVPRLADIDRDADVYALDVLEGILDGYDGARFTRNLVRGSRVASEVGVGYDAVARGPALFVVEATPAEGRTLEELERALRAEIAKVAEEGVSEEELARVKAQVIAAQVFKRDSIFRQAMEIAIFEIAGQSHKRIDDTLDKIRAVTAAQVRQVAAKYFGDDTFTVATLTPLPMTAKPRAAPGGLRH
jgi:zinc protease